jgi:AraC family transcriptional regulator, transcriptional activator of pobA
MQKSRNITATRRRERYHDPRGGVPAFQAQDVSIGLEGLEPPRTNYFTVYWIEKGRGTFSADAAEHAFVSDAMLFFVPYQHIRIAPTRPVRATMLQFHANFLCVETFHAESGCSGVLFNNIYGVPMVVLDELTKAEVAELVSRIRREQSRRGLAHEEVLLASMKVLLILATRLKSPADGACATGALDSRQPVLGELRELIERHYQELHSPSDYAALLHMTPKTLGRIVREHHGKTLTDLIRERILTHAKWQLLHTLRPVKEIAGDVGFQDELYFSRLFKKSTGVSPTFFREFETEIRGGRNLSMLSSHAPIQATR